MDYPSPTSPRDLATGWLLGSGPSGSLDNPLRSIARARALTALIEAHYREAKRHLSDDSPEISSLARLMDEVHDHETRMSRTLLSGASLDHGSTAGGSAGLGTGTPDQYHIAPGRPAAPLRAGQKRRPSCRAVPAIGRVAPQAGARRPGRRQEHGGVARSRRGDLRRHLPLLPGLGVQPIRPDAQHGVSSAGRAGTAAR